MQQRDALNFAQIFNVPYICVIKFNYAIQKIIM